MTDCSNHLLTELLAQAQKDAAHIPLHSFKLLLSSILQCSIPELLLRHESLSPSQYDLYLQYASRLKTGEPLQYILGVAWFYGMELKVTPAVLIPRPETEGLVELVLSHAPKGSEILDIGTGSGAIAIALKTLNPSLHVHATDISEAALSLASQNANTLSAEVCFEQADLFPAATKLFDIIVSNPPYISARDYQCLPPEVRDYEPAQALLAGEEGLEYYRRVLQGAVDYLKPGGSIFFEIGETQAAQIRQMALELGYFSIETKLDLCDRDRYMQIKFR